MLQKTANGNLLKITAGDLAKECCCGGTTPSVCANGNPEIYLQIFDADYAGGSITWCNEVFSQSDIQNGTPKGPVCPTNYSSNKFTSTSEIVTGVFWRFWKANELWNYNTANGLYMGQGGYTVRHTTTNTNSYVRYAARPKLSIKPGGNVWIDSAFTSRASAATNRPVLANTGYANNYDLGIVATGPAFANILLTAGTYNNFRLTRGWIGTVPGTATLGQKTTYTSGGIQYSWWQGNGW